MTEKPCQNQTHVPAGN